MYQDTIKKLIKGIKVFETTEEMKELMNESLWSVFDIEDFIEPNDEETHKGFETSWWTSRKLAEY